MKSANSIYLVDDDEDDMMLLKEALENAIVSVCITEVGDGKELIDLINLKNPASLPTLILMDMNMPRVNGLEALFALKSSLKTQHIPVIMISTSTDQQLIRKAYEEGVCAFIIKPVSILDYRMVAEAVNVCFLNNYGYVQKPAVFRDFTNKSILVIEDNPDHWELMQLGLKQNLPDVKVIRLSDKVSTLNFLTDEWNHLKPPPELIILDLYLPTRREGLNLLDSIRYFFILHRLIPVPVIVFSSSDSQEDVDACYQHRASAYMIKNLNFTSSYLYFHDLCDFWWRIITLPKKLRIQ